VTRLDTRQQVAALRSSTGTQHSRPSHVVAEVSPCSLHDHDNVFVTYDVIRCFISVPPARILPQTWVIHYSNSGHPRRFLKSRNGQ